MPARKEVERVDDRPGDQGLESSDRRRDTVEPEPLASRHAARQPDRLGRPVAQGHARASAPRARRVRGSRRAALPRAERAVGAGPGTVPPDPARAASELHEVLRGHRR